MSSKAEQERVKNPITVTFHAARAVLLVLVVIAALFAMAERAEAAGTPTQLIIWTDKKVYTDGWYDGATHAEGTGYDRNLAVTVYAVVIDDDGNLMRGRTLGGLLNATNQWDHTQKATDTYHHAINPTSLYRNISLSFGDSGTGGDFKANDGIYVAYSDVAELPAGFVDDHLLINISVNVSGTQLKTYTEVLFTKGRCHKTTTNTHASPGGTHVGNADPCTICHSGYEHQFDKLPETIGLRSFHVGKITPVDKSLPGKVTGFNYNLSKNDGTGVDVSWATNSPGSEYCYTCHYKSGSGTAHDWWDFATAAPGDNVSKRPSCAWATAASGATCHASTNITQSSLINIEWKWKQKGPSNSTSHNHTGNQANVSCDICHGNYHVIKPFPNTTNREINAQCVLCHNITGGLNITANGGTNVNHTNPDCKACHIDANLKLDSHLVPTAEFASANCTKCHDLGGKSPYHIDYNTFNKSDYVHNKYNMSTNPPKYPLNFNASNGSALRPAENKICWGCHGDDPNNDGKANFSEQPASDHPSKYKNPRTCEQCHQNASAPWKAPQNLAHSNNTANVRTPGAPNCYDCHGQPALLNNSNNDPDYNNSLKATLAYHYGTGFPALEQLRHKDGYCTKYCHQNTSSPVKEEFLNKENMQRPNHSARTSRLANQSCVADACHAAYELHGSEMRKPTLASGAFNNSACTASGCHNVSDPPYEDYKYHNNVVNCTSCHMDNKGFNIHPVKYLQNDGLDFAQVNTTAASCKLCHKNSQGDVTLAKWGVTARKVGAQHHSDDPKNGSKWNKTQDPYWDYVPHEVTFVTGWKNNSNRGFITNFNAMNDTNYSAARISENTTEDSFVGHYPNNTNFTSSASGWFASGTATTLAWSNLAEDGNPAGGITVASTTKSQIVDANWTVSFTYPRSGAVAEGLIKLESKLVKAANINTGALKVINVSINDNSGVPNITEVYNRSLPNTAEPDWVESGELSIPNPDTVFWKNGVYNVTIRTRWTGLGGSTTPNIKAAYDNVFVNISEVDYKKYNFTFYINNTPNSDNLYTLFVGYQTHTEPARLYVLNGSSFQYRADLDSGAFTKAIIPLSQQEYAGGNITLRINDTNNGVDVHADYLDIEYMFVESYQWINNSRMHYPCEYCHASNKHNEHALGIPYEFKGNNYEGQQVNDTTTWCASCHWQGYSSGGKTYNDMVQAFLNHPLPVPPEITGNATYGANQSNPAYKNHSSWGKNDSACWGCHKGKLASGNSSVFLHNVSTGTSGGVNCTACHNIGGSATGEIVNFTSVNASMHGNLNKNATGNATNKPCWGCHGTKNGTWANESDQPANDHNTTYKSSPRKCEDCHNATTPQFNGKPVTDHIPSGISGSTDVNTSKYNKTYCSYCHNNSIGASSDPDGMGITSAMNASSAHYGANRTANKLMGPVATNNSTDCAYCHKNTSNMLKWGILNGSLSNISNKNGTLNTGFNHNTYTQSSGCYQCHGGTVANFHVSAMSPGEKGNPNCAGCHNVSAPGSYAKVDFTAINISVHGNLNNKSSSSPANITNKPCWGCHGTVNVSGWANESDQPANDHNTTYKSSPRKCEDCHINGSVRFNAPGLTEHIMPGKNASTEINVTDGYCSVCHNNSITSNSDNDGMGILSVINASAAHYAKDANANLMTTVQHSDNCTYCHFVNNGSSAWLTPRKPLTSTHSSYDSGTSPSTCWGCHVDSQGEPATFHVQEINKGAGSGPNCRSCHNTSDTDTGRGHIDGNVFNTSIHGNMNTTGGVDLNEPCWGCHGSGESDGHNNSRYKNPYACADCHLSTGARYAWAIARGALNVSEHFTNGSEIKASYNATVLYSCLKCHQDIGEMRLNNSDTDANKTAWTSGGDNYNGTIGGNNSPYHYGRKRSDIRNGTSTNCTYCHQNSSTAFASAMQNPTVNKSIYEHTDNGTRNITGRACTDAGCHNSSFIHNSTLTKPAVSNWTQGKYDYCAPCHKESGISTKKVRGHNTSNISTPGMDCGYCHNASSQGAVSNGALRIHSTRLTNKSTTNSTCETCHRDVTYVSASRIIKTHYPNATTDKGNTSESGRTCELCHGVVGQNKLHASMVKKPADNCQSCHLNGSKTSPYNATTTKASINAFQHDNASHAPSNQSGICERCHNTTNRSETFHFTDYANGTSVAPGWASWTNGTQANCIDCHRNKTNQAPFYALFSSSSTHTTSTLDGCYNCHTDSPTYASNPKTLHYVVQAPGNANCTLCHDIAGEAGKKIDVAAMNKSDSIHLNLNKDATVVKASPSYAPDSRRCWACHGNGSEPSSHPSNFKNAYKCADCHVPSGGRNTNYTPNNTILNVTEHYRGGSDIRTPMAAYCTDCHNKTEMLKSNSDTGLSATNPANDSVSHYGRNRSEIRSGINTSCAYCHQNSTTAFENVMLGSLNKSIREHTDSGTRNTSAGSCTNSKCHSQGLIHNSTLTKPAVQNWTANSKDYCAPCHKAGDSNATKYVYAHNTSNISAVSMDCGYCHNASSQGANSSGALKLHTSGITNTSTTNSTCVTCHKDSKYVGTSRTIRTHYPGASAGKANTSLSTWDCEECHGWSTGTKMHSSGLIKKPNYDCNACHNASGGSSYKSNPALFVNVTRHDNTSLNGANVNCNTCHNNTNRIEPFHFTNWSNGTVEATGWGGWANGTRANCTDCHVTYANQAPFYAEPTTYPNWHKGNYSGSLNDCYQCHSNLTVLNSGDNKAPVQMHNVTRTIDWGNCNACHAPKYGGAPKVDNTSLSALNSMHAGIDGATSSNINPACKACHGGNTSIHKNTTANNCTYCHIAGKLKYTTKNVSEHILNGSYANTSVNTSRYQQVFCDLCHNNSIANFNDDTPGTSNATTAHYGQNKSANKLMSPGINSTDCNYCHKNTSNMAKWGVLSTSKANISNRGDHNGYSASTQCYECHVDSKGLPVTFHADDLNQGVGSNPNCINCHNTGSSNRKVDFAITNDSSNIHKNLNIGASAGSYDSANKPCWACHGNGSATEHINTTYKAPRICESCHINASAPYGALQVKEHYWNGSDIKATNAANNTRSCLACHQNISEMLLQNNDPDAGTFDAEGDGVNGTNISAYHYGKKRSDLRSGVNTSCGYCHQNASSVFPLTTTNRSIYEHTNSTANITNSTLTCTSSKCHATGFIHNSTLTKPRTQVWTPGMQDYCAPCHKAGDINATKYVYSHNTSVTPINDDCGYCHNASSQGIAGSRVNVHTPNLTNTTAPAVYANCAGCHNGTSLYVGSGKQILSHMPNASQYRGNTSQSSYTCELCHNLSGKPSMHSMGMNRSNGTCNTCHFNRTSPYKSTKKIIASNDYNHTYVGQKTCAITQCHNASNGSVFHMDKYAAGVVAEPEKFNSIWNDRYTMGFTESSYPYVDCIDCHRAPYNNSYPFNNTYPFNYSTNYSFNYEANHTGENKKVHSASDQIKSCYNCHTNRTDGTDRYMVHNVTIEPLVGGPACIKCHNLSATSDVPSNKRVNHTALNQSVHKNLTNFTAWNNSPNKATTVLLDSACWTCHASDITNIPGNEHPDRAGGISKAFRCTECHTPGGYVSISNPQVYQNATRVYKHYPGAALAGAKIHSTNYTAGSCQVCHNNSIVFSNISTDKTKLNATVSHYAANTSIGMMGTNTDRSCEECHNNTAPSFGVPKQLVDVYKHSMNSDCQGPCHNPYYVNKLTVNPIKLHNASVGIYYTCYVGNCHDTVARASRGGRR